MQRLLQMCEVVKKQGIVDNGSKIDTEHFWSCVSQCQPFVFSLSGDPKEITEVADENGVMIDLPFDAPFSIFSIEMMRGAVSIPSGRDVHCQVWVHCLLCYECSPRVFLYYVLTSLQFGEGPLITRVVHGDGFDSFTVKFIDRINSEKCGTEHIRERVKIGTGKNKRTVTFRRIVHVRPKKIFDRSDLDAMSGRVIEWTHRWWRRGHWREIAGLGKDRSGTYCVSGKTWVVEHTAGAPDAPVISKVRVVD